MLLRNMTMTVKYHFLLITALMLSSLAVYAQADNKYIRKGNREYNKENYPESEILYRKAIDKNRSSQKAVFNAGDALYKQKKYEDAGKMFLDNLNSGTADKNQKSSAFYNLGNSLLMNNKIQESIEAYKNSLRLNPGNMEAKYNLAYAQDLLAKQQQEQQQQDKNEKSDQDDKKNDKQDQEKEQNQNQNQNQNQEQNQDNQADNQKMNEQQQGLSKEDAERILNALENDEKRIQEKVKLEKAAKARIRTMKNW